MMMMLMTMMRIVFVERYGVRRCRDTA